MSQHKELIERLRGVADGSMCDALLPGWVDDLLREAADALERPIPVRTWCPDCGFQHIDEGEWATRPHKTHLCGNCGREWRPAPVSTVGVP